VAEALQFDLNEIVKYARRMIALSPQPLDEKLKWIDNLLQRDIDDDAKKAYLAASIMNDFTRGALDDFLRESKKRRT
jgi:hypothetical protein